MESPRRCRRIKRLRGESRDDYLLVEIEPPLIGQQFGLGATDISLVIVATRHEGASLFPIKKWPVYVHVARVLVENPADREDLKNTDLEEIGWAELYPTETRASAKA